MSSTPTLAPDDRQVVNDFLNDHFNLDELKALCATLGIAHDELEHDTRSKLARALIGYCERRERLGALLSAGHQARPEVTEAAKIKALAGRFPSAGEGDALPAISSTLPRAGVFFGRVKELAIIAEAVRPDTRTWGALIDGPGGIGKTALAIQAAHAAPGSDFPLKLFLSAKVRELTPTGEQPLQDYLLPNFLALITELGKQVGRSDIERQPHEQRSGLVLHALTVERVLLVIDNVETFEEPERVRLYQFLSRLPPRCKAIVTSRRRSDIDARAIRLDRLEKPDALALLAQLAEQNPRLAREPHTERERLYEIANGNPLLLRWVAAQLGRDHSQCRTIADAVAFMGSAPVGNDPLEYIFGDLLDTFTKNEMAVLAALTHFTQPAQLQWIADMTQLNPRVAQTALEDLSDRSLVLSDAEGKTYLLPALAATYLRRARPEAVAQTGHRLADRAYALVQENGYEEYERFLTLEAEWPMVAAALPVLLAGDNARLQRACNAFYFFLDFSGRWDELIKLSEEAEGKAGANNDAGAAGWRAYQAGYTYQLLGNAEQVLACAARCEQHWKGASARERATALQLRGLGYRMQAKYAEAITAYREALVLHQSIKAESVDVALTLNDLADAECLARDYAAAERDYTEALRIARKINDRQGVAAYTGNLAGLALDREQWAKAETLAREALGLAEAIGRQELVASDCERIAKATLQQGRAREGLPFARRAVEIYTRLRSPDLAWAQRTLAECEAGVI